MHSAREERVWVAILKPSLLYRSGLLMQAQLECQRGFVGSFSFRPTRPHRGEPGEPNRPDAWSAGLLARGEPCRDLFGGGPRNGRPSLRSSRREAAAPCSSSPGPALLASRPAPY